MTLRRLARILLTPLARVLAEIGERRTRSRWRFPWSDDTATHADRPPAPGRERD